MNEQTVGCMWVCSPIGFSCAHAVFKICRNEYQQCTEILFPTRAKETNHESKYSGVVLGPRGLLAFTSLHMRIVGEAFLGMTNPARCFCVGLLPLALFVAMAVF